MRWHCNIWRGHAFAPAADRWNHRRRRGNRGEMSPPALSPIFHAEIREDVVIRQRLAWRDFTREISSRTNIFPLREWSHADFKDQSQPYLIFSLILLEFCRAEIRTYFYWNPWIFSGSSSTESLGRGKNWSRKKAKLTSRSLERINCARLRGHRSVNCKRDYMLKPRLIIEVLRLRWKSMVRATCRWKIAPVRVWFITPVRYMWHWNKFAFRRVDALRAVVFMIYLSRLAHLRALHIENATPLASKRGKICNYFPYYRVKNRDCFFFFFF